MTTTFLTKNKLPTTVTTSTFLISGIGIGAGFAAGHFLVKRGAMFTIPLALAGGFAGYYIWTRMQ